MSAGKRLLVIGQGLTIRRRLKTTVTLRFPHTGHINLDSSREIGKFGPRVATSVSRSKVVDRLRQSLALQYIKEPSVSVAQIAWLLGYERPTSFNHAFARWTGRSASGARDENQSRNDGKVSKLGLAP